MLYFELGLMKTFCAIELLLASTAPEVVSSL